MATLYGQNFRIYTYDSTTEKYKVIGMASSCTVTLTNNTEDASHKDIVGMSQQPVVTTQSWQVQVESLDVVDIATLLTAVKNRTKFTIAWDESQTLNNQTIYPAYTIPWARKGEAYLTDLTVNFNNRENSTKSLQFTGVSALDTMPAVGGDATEVISVGDYTKGQFVRLFLGSDNTTTPSKCIAAATQLSFHVSMSLEDASTKDTEGMWQIQEPTGLSFDISTTALMRSGETIAAGAPAAQAVGDIMSIYEAGTPVKFQIANVSGDNNRTKGSVIVSGSVLIQSLTLNGSNRQRADYSAQFVGYNQFIVGS